MSLYHSVNAYLFVKDADATMKSYAEIFGAVQLDREPGEGPGVQRAVVQIGDGVIAMTELLPPANYFLLDTDDVLGVEIRVRAGNWFVTQDPALRGKYVVMHAIDPAGITWIIQQALTSPTYHALNPYVADPDASTLLDSYVAVFGGEVIDREMTEDGGIARAVVKVGDASLAMTDQLPVTRYVLVNTLDLDGISDRIGGAADWTITQPPSSRGSFTVMHATDPAGITWIIQQPILSSAYRGVNPYLFVKDADSLVKSYKDVLGAKLIDREPASGPGVARAVVQIGDAVIAMTELLPPANYILMQTSDIGGVQQNIAAAADAGWLITQQPARRGTFQVMHASDPFGVSWIIQQPLREHCAP